MKLDKSKPYGEITGDTKGRRYEQGGNYFDATGNLVGGEVAKLKPSKPAPKLEPKVDDVPVEVNDQVAAQLGG